MKLVLNKSHTDGFDLSEEALIWMENETGCPYRSLGSQFINRHDPTLVQAVETLGHKASANGANLCVVVVGDDLDYEIEGYPFERVVPRSTEFDETDLIFAPVNFGI